MPSQADKKRFARMKFDAAQGKKFQHFYNFHKKMWIQSKERFEPNPATIFAGKKAAWQVLLYESPHVKDIDHLASSEIIFSGQR